MASIKWETGLGRLPASEFSRYFSIPIDHLLAKPVDYLMQWFLAVRQGRILLDPDRLLQDEFVTSKSLQQWVGISYEVTDEEMEPILQDAIIKEITLGIGNLPPQQFEQHFNTSLQTLLSGPLSVQKLWFQQVRQG